ncbi:hypothetical protein [Nitratireductor sp. StC3]|uniref:AbiTii domain-containing protein n=1 Tax=Nitratireductor sp. StC3 TaxID=2126741 RepID=UPI000D0D5E63|nr:hypothetical protein [Nitratireductor sp. StC3]PSM15936.1 hypothetical protein C7T96_22650 [Nitratireductor sp. StC3]
MGGLIEEIQRDALDSKVPIEALLRRVKLAAAKLQLGDLQSWVEQELNGYPGELPAYRKVVGQPAAWNPYNGWIPVHDDERLMEIISDARVGQSAASLRDLLDKNSDGPLHLQVPAGLVSQLNQMMKFQTPRMVLQISRGHIVSILDTVRNMVLDWAIEMEKKGVLGHGMSFDAGETKMAQAAMQTINIGQIGSMVGNLGTGNSTGDITVSQASVSRVSETVAKIKQSVPQLVEEGADGAKLGKVIEHLEAELATQQPKPSRLKGLLEDARSALAGAAGNLTSEGALAMIAAAMKALGS